MKRRAVLTSLTGVAMASAATLPQTRPLLIVSGRIGRINNRLANTYDFSEGAFLSLPPTSIKTATPWTATSVFVGPLLTIVMREAGVSSGTLNIKSLDGYSTPIPWPDLERYGVILAHSQNGKRLSIKRWGPLWTIYPRDQYPGLLSGPLAESRFIWQVKKIEVSQ